MKTKNCSSCKSDYEDYGQKASLCRGCKKVYDREYYKNRCPNKKSESVAKDKQRKLRVKQEVYDYLLSNPCIICTESRVATLQFDHRKPENKIDAVSDMIRRGFSRESVFLEIAKCDVLCANCHAVKTSEQFNWYKDIVR